MEMWQHLQVISRRRVMTPHFVKGSGLGKECRNYYSIVSGGTVHNLVVPRASTRTRSKPDAMLCAAIVATSLVYLLTVKSKCECSRAHVFLEKDREHRQALYSLNGIAMNDVEHEISKDQHTLFICGVDRRGRPTLVARPSMHVAGTKEESLRAVEECLETVRSSLRRLPRGESKILVLYDLGNAGYKNLDMTFSRKLIDELVREFPECLDKVLVINSHWSMAAAWRAIQTLLHPETKQKVAFYGSDYREKLLEYVDGDHPYLRRLGAT